jgi:hypothetical protein
MRFCDLDVLREIVRPDPVVTRAELRAKLLKVVTHRTSQFVKLDSM